MQGPFRSDHQALAAQCDALRRQLERAEASAAELAALRAELEEKLARLADARVTELERSEAARRARGRGFRLGAAVVVLCAGAGALLLKLPGPGPAVPETGAAWFERARPHCNPVEVALWLRSNPPPANRLGASYATSCLALAGHIDEARSRLTAMPADARPRALQILFNLAHPIADSGDDRSAGPIMELVLEFWPENFQAVYHAGISEYGLGEHEKARRRLTQFLTMYSVEDAWRRNAKQVLKQLEHEPSAGPAPGQRTPE